MQTIEDWCPKCRKRTEHEVIESASGAKFVSCLACQRWEANRKELIAATKAREAARPWWRTPAIVAGCLVALAIVGIVGKTEERRKEREAFSSDDSDCVSRTNRQIQAARAAADRACPCKTLACAQAVMNEAESSGLLLDACAGATEYQRSELRRMFQALAVCVEVHR